MSDRIDFTDEVCDGAVIEVVVRGQKQNIQKNFVQLLSPLMNSILKTLAPCDTTLIIIPDIDADTLGDFLHVIQNFTNKSFQKVMSEEQVRRLDDIFELLKINTNFFKINMLELAEEGSNDVQEEKTVNADTDKTSDTDESEFLTNEKSLNPVKPDPEEEDFNVTDVTTIKTANTVKESVVGDEKDLSTECSELEDLFGLNDGLTEPIRNPPFVSTEKRTEIRKSKLGRPPRQHPLKITEPIKEEEMSLYTNDEIKSLKFQRLRELNNEASKKCRAIRRGKQLSIMEDLLWEKNRNKSLQAAHTEMIRKIQAFKNYMYNIGLIKPKIQ